jgi:3-vinyl bacteriochlorophyllide hydratase
VQRQSPSWAASLTAERAVAPGRGLYTPEQRIRRDATRWTLVQGILAPVQFFVFLVSLVLVLRYLATGAGYEIATVSIVLKTAVLYLIMVTGAIWEKVVFGQYLFAPAFWWEDAVSMLVIALHTAYVLALIAGSSNATELMLLALAAYLTYVINAAQFVWKLRMARLQGAATAPAGNRGPAAFKQAVLQS